MPSPAVAIICLSSVLAAIAANRGTGCILLWFTNQHMCTHMHPVQSHVWWTGAGLRVFHLAARCLSTLLARDACHPVRRSDTKQPATGQSTYLLEYVDKQLGCRLSHCHDILQHHVLLQQHPLRCGLKQWAACAAGVATLEAGPEEVLHAASMQSTQYVGTLLLGWWCLSLFCKTCCA